MKNVFLHGADGIDESPTDFQKLKALLTEFGVGYEEIVPYDQNGYLIKCDQGHDKVGGYIGFFTCFEFCSGGKFIQMGAYE